MEPDDELWRRVASLAAGLVPGDLRDLDSLLDTAIEQWGARVAVDPMPSRRMPRRKERVRYVVRIELNRAEPPIWRTLEIRSDVTLDTVHRMIQAAFGWWDYHLYRFALGGDPFDPGAESFTCPEDLEWEDDGSIPTAQVRLDETLHSPGDVLHYVYDFGDNWDLTLHLEDVTEVTDDVLARCIAGERAAPPEDCGGVRDAEELARVMDDLAAFDLVEINTALQDPFAGLAEWGLRPEVIDLVTRARSTPMGDDLLVRAMTATGPEVSTPEQRTQELAAIQWFLDYVGQQGRALTAAGYLRPADVAALREVLPATRDQSFRASREIDLVELLGLRESLQALGLLRKAKGHLSLTKAGVAAAQDAQVLWRHLAARLAVGGTDSFAHVARTAALIFIGSGSRDPYAESAALLTELRWQTATGDPVPAYAVRHACRSAHEVLTNISVEAVSWEERWPPSATATDLARAALLEVRGKPVTG